METIERSIDVGVPVTTAYDQWTQFEEFPAFMEGVKEVHQLNETLLHWVVEVGGRVKEWDAQIVEQRPDQKVAWRSVAGTPEAGAVTFEEVSPSTTRITVRMEHEPENIVEKAGSMLGVADRRLDDDLHRFKDMIESRGTASGSWRGEVG